MHINNAQEQVDIAKGKRKIIKFQKAQQEIEKDMVWVEVPGAIGNMRKLIKKK